MKSHGHNDVEVHIKLFLSFIATYWKNLPINRKMLNIKKKKRRSKKKHVLTEKKRKRKWQEL